MTKVNDTTLRVTKNGDYSIHYFVRIYTSTRSTNVTVTGARGAYIEFIPTSVTVTKNETTEFDIRVLTNFYDVNMLANSTIQWYRSDTGQWKTTAFQAASYVPNYGSGDSPAYNEAHEDRDFTIHCRIVNPTASGNISFFESMPVSQYYYVPYTAVGSANIYTLNSDGTAPQSEDSIEYHGTSSTRGYQIYSTHPYEATTIPQGVRFYGGSSGDAGTSSMTIDWGGGTPGTSKTVVFTNTGGATCNFVCHYVTQ